MEILHINETYQFGRYTVTLINACNGSASILVTSQAPKQEAYLDFSDVVIFTDLGLQLSVRDNHLIIKRSINLLTLQSILPLPYLTPATHSSCCTT